jgi:hypothetical protein
MKPEAEMDGRTVDEVIRQLIESVPVLKSSGEPGR